jgi:DMSO reductase anchor subunit
MHPAFSVIFLTTLIGVGQGFFLALFTGQSYAAVELLPAQDSERFFALGSVIALAFLAAGLGASFFHLGRPARAWRAASQWRTSWLSREVILLPVVMGLVALYGMAHYFDWEADLLGNGMAGQLTLLIGTAATVATFGLFLTTAMIYAAVKFLQEWSSPLTVLNYILLGGASGFTLATAFSAFQAPALIPFYGGWAMALTAAALITRSASLVRNTRLKRKSTLQSAIGVRHTQIRQKSMGMMGGAFNTREFFHGVPALFLRAIKWIFLALTFVVPLALLWGGIDLADAGLLSAAFLTQYAGLLFERWLFFAQASHPQNLYYQTV